MHVVRRRSAAQPRTGWRPKEPPRSPARARSRSSPPARQRGRRIAGAGTASRPASTTPRRKRSGPLARLHRESACPRWSLRPAAPRSRSEPQDGAAPPKRHAARCLRQSQAPRPRSQTAPVDAVGPRPPTANAPDRMAARGHAAPLCPPPQQALRVSGCGRALPRDLRERPGPPALAHPSARCRALAA